MRKKHAKRTVPDVRAGTPRPVSAAPPTARAAAAGPSYPRAADLIARSPEWQRFLEDALRAILRPAAVAGATLLLSTGCDAAMAAAGSLLGDEPLPAATAPAYGGGAWTGGGLGGGASTGGSFGIAPDKGLVATQGGGVAMHQLPGVPPTAPTMPWVVTPPGTRIPGSSPWTTPPGRTAGVPQRVTPHIPPAVDPAELDGDVAVVHPRPLPMPPATRGGARPVAPQPDVPMPGGLRPVMPGEE